MSPSFKAEKILSAKLSDYKIKCKCGHVVMITPRNHKNKVLCSYCKNYVYKDKKAEFEERLKNQIKKEV